MLHSAIEKTKIPEDDSPTYNAVELTKNGNVARIILENQVYTLRITRSGKLILTKWLALFHLFIRIMWCLDSKKNAKACQITPRPRLIKGAKQFQTWPIEIS